MESDQSFMEELVKQIKKSYEDIVDNTISFKTEKDRLSLLNEIDKEFLGLVDGLKPSKEEDQKNVLCGITKMLGILANKTKLTGNDKNLNIDLSDIEKSLGQLVKNTKPPELNDEASNAIAQFKELEKYHPNPT